MKSGFPFSKKSLIIGSVLLLLLLIAIFLYIQIQIERHKPLTGDTDSAVFECPNVVLDKQSAKECFNIFFEERLKEEEIVRGVGNIPDHIIELYEQFKESQLLLTEPGNLWIIINDDYGLPYYIKDSVVYFMHG